VYTLYFSPGTASMCVHQALIEIGAPFELVRVDLATGQQRDASYLKLNPTGRVPTLVIDGSPFGEVAALLQILAFRHPEARLMPQNDPLKQAQWHQWTVYLANTLQAGFRLWFYPDDLSGDPAIQAAIKAGVRGTIEKCLQRIDGHLGEHSPFMLGEQFSSVDLYLTMLLRWSRNMPRPATDWPALNRYCRHLCARESWKRLCAVEELVGWPA